MESPKSRESRSSASPTTLSPRREFPSPYYKEKTTHVRFLATNAEAGSVIGKNGSTIADLQSQSGARIQLSSNHEFFPGTSDRIVMVSGIIDEILKGVELILVKFFNEFYVEDDVDSRTRVRIIAPNSSCGGIIGKGGATIKSFIKDSKAGIKISPQDSNYLGLNDRIITLNGTLEELMRAVELVLMKLGEDPYYSQSSSVPFSYAGFQNMPYTYVFPPPATAAYNAMNFGPMGPVGKFKNNKEDRSNSVTMGVPDDHIGIVVGRGGRNILEISQVSGAKIKISDRGDFMSGTSDRKVTIMGSKRAIRVAEAMISHKIALASSPER